MHHSRSLAHTGTRLKSLFVATASLGLLFATPAFAQPDVPPPTPLDESQWRQLELAVGERAREIANSREFFDEVSRPVEISARLDRTSNSVVLGLDERFGRYVGSLELEDMQDSVDVGLEELTAQIPGFAFIEWRIGGRSMDYWFNLSASVSEDPAASQAVAPANEAKAPVVVVAAGHGAYRHEKYGWTMQRERVNGVLEDEITQDFAEHLARFIVRNGAEPVRLRGGAVSLVHEPSGLQWRSLAARYFIENWRPENPDLWNTHADRNGPLKERDQDIRSRPLYANFINAAAVVHVHTNASSALASGSRVFVHTGRADDFRLAQLTLCSMRESIHADARYADYNVPLQPSPSDKKGENSYAKVPSMIVEVGFHTNPNDAKILQDPDFQRLSMRGVAKGMRLFREGASCGPFAIQQQATFTASLGRDAWMPVSISGNPVYPVDIKATQIHCGKETCRTKAKIVHSKEQADAYRFNHLCWRGDENSPIEFVVEARDVDGVRTPPVTYQLKCVKPG
ncbi:MAG: N-acetylmuramoyl-L-alanine amidase [Luteibacter sp.]|uniref:N-acetylmuramoyl-L-alanine amidase n=1 Tax=Luteibacter sp. TaxID=1886636 RepID=UPI0028097586|nr:N-acetylmuramoyl-L-alanine amidase [Luteibacter sp.]MDQ7997398.1 N-acetylmuramoyl-L-alanine amidase [Luteibacter sp.]MDQ8048328.1 N-acetylmuramoyl-L-alanine amidase [Luteibacter sp.]